MLSQLSPVDITSVTNEIFDMVGLVLRMFNVQVKPEVHERITLKDLIKCGKRCFVDFSPDFQGNGHTVCSILTDANGFIAYESREGTVVDEDEDE